MAPLLGLWVERPTVAVSHSAEMAVVSPVPWCPPLPPVDALSAFTRFRAVPPRELRYGIEVHHPRFVVGPGQRTYAQEARAYRHGVQRRVAQLRRWFPFDLIHAHMSYPDGVVAARLAAQHQVPVVVTEHVPWSWLDDFPAVRRQMLAAVPGIAALLPVSRWVQETIVSAVGRSDRLRVVPNGVDETVFHLGPAADRDPDKILYVGMPRAASKGVDVLLKGMADVLARRPSVHLTVVGDAIYRQGLAHLADLRATADRPPLRGRVTFTGTLSPAEVARHMATSALLVLPSKLESFGAVLVEALACGTPVVATRCGGPEDIVTDAVGCLVPVDDPHALAEAMDRVLAEPGRYPAEVLRDYAVSNFSYRAVAEQLLGVYREVLAG